MNNTKTIIADFNGNHELVLDHIYAQDSEIRRLQNTAYAQESEIRRLGDIVNSLSKDLERKNAVLELADSSDLYLSTNDVMPYSIWDREKHKWYRGYTLLEVLEKAAGV